MRHNTFSAHHQIWLAFWPYVLLVVAVVAAYGNVYGNHFIFDDDTLILQNQYLRGAQPLSHIFMTSIGGGAGSTNDFYRPLQILLYVFLNWLVGLSTISFHLLNVGLHAANACLIYALGRKLGFKPVAVFLAALLWALHPIQTEAVTYISATADPLYVLFCLTGLLVALPDFSWRHVMLASPVFILALLSKETAAVFPLLAMACLYLVSKKRLSPKIYLRTLPFWTIDLAYLALRLTVFNFQADDTAFNLNPGLHLYATHILVRIYTALATLPYYLALLVYPAGLHLERQFPIHVSFWAWDVLAGVGMVVTAVAQVMWGRGKRAVALSWGLLWFGAAQSIHTGIVVPLNAFFLEHWMYLPSVGLALGSAQSFALWLEKLKRQTWNKVALAAALLLALVYGVMTWRQNRVWHDEVVFYINILNHGERSMRAYNNLGKFYMDRGDYNQAMFLFRKVLELGDVMPDVHQNIAALLTRQPGWKTHPEDAIHQLKQALEMDPNYLPACDGLVYIYSVTGDYGQEAFYRTRAEKLRRQFMP